MFVVQFLHFHFKAVHYVQQYIAHFLKWENAKRFYQDCTNGYGCGREYRKIISTLSNTMYNTDF